MGSMIFPFAISLFFFENGKLFYNLNPGPERLILKYE